jgi:hypothetical protein
MKTIEIFFKFSNTSKFVKTDATSEEIQNAINFIPDTDIDKILSALRILGRKATEIKLEPVDIFEV